MAETKTKFTGASVDEYLASRASPEQLKDCKAIMAICKRVTGQKPKMWGPSIVGYGSYSYKYASGRSGEAALAGFAVRGKDLVSWRHSLPGRSPMSDAGIPGPATPNPRLDATTYGAVAKSENTNW